MFLNCECEGTQLFNGTSKLKQLKKYKVIFFYHSALYYKLHFASPFKRFPYKEKYKITLKFNLSSSAFRLCLNVPYFSSFTLAIYPCRDFFFFKVEKIS